MDLKKPYDLYFTPAPLCFSSASTKSPHRKPTAVKITKKCAQVSSTKIQLFLLKSEAYFQTSTNAFSFGNGVNMVVRKGEDGEVLVRRLRLLQVFLCFIIVSECCAFSLLPGHRTFPRERKFIQMILRHSAFGAGDDPVVSTIRSLADYHEGEWLGRARSFTVTQDTAAGIVQRKLSPEYTVNVKLSTSRTTVDTTKEQAISASKLETGTITLSETVHWADKFSHRFIPLFTPPGVLSSEHQEECAVGDVDVDEVDGSYSLDIKQPTDFPSVLSGFSGKDSIDKKRLKFVVEHCIAAGEDRRCRCFAVYGEDDSLLRIVVSDEKRVKKADVGRNIDDSAENVKIETIPNDMFEIDDVKELENDIDRLVDKMTAKRDERSQENSYKDTQIDDPNDDNEQFFSYSTPKAPAGSDRSEKSPVDSTTGSTQSLSPYPISLLEVSNGVWLGDMIIRETPNISASPAATRRGKGFGQEKFKSTPPSSYPKRGKSFAEWNTGVQKIAWRWIWNFEEEIRQIVDAGKTLGSSMDIFLQKSLAGNVCVDESFSRRKPKDQRMVYIDWGQDSVGFLLGPFTVRLPRYVNFDPFALSSRAAAVSKPIYTEFGIFQNGSLPNSPSSNGVGEICCSKIGRLYNFEGRLKQGCTSFYTYKPFEFDNDGYDDDDDDYDDADV